jgi:hypothetical protein
MKKQTQRNGKPNSLPCWAAAARFACLIGMGFLAVDLVPRALQFSLYAQEKSPAVESTGMTSSAAVHVLGFEAAKRGEKGNLTVQSAGVQFESGKTKAQVDFPSIREVFTGEDNTLVFGGKRGTLVRAALPYESGRILGLFQEKVSVLTLEYQDSNGALHGAVFKLPKGQSVEVKRQLDVSLLACGCAATVKSSDPMVRAISEGPSSATEARDGQKFSSIQIEPVESADVAVPPDFRMAVYEYLIAQVRKTGKFQQVYRSGDRAAGDIPDLAVLRVKVEGFRQGSEMERAVTTVAGATSIKMSVRVLSRDGQVEIDRTVEGKVRFFGENLRATYDFAKKTAKVLSQSL